MGSSGTFKCQNCGHIEGLSIGGGMFWKQYRCVSCDKGYRIPSEVLWEFQPPEGKRQNAGLA